MSFLKKGPEIKLSALKDVKVPGVVADVYYDLKDRHLLPVAAILLVAIVAVPIAIGGSGSGGEAAAPPAEAGASGLEAQVTGALVAEAQPGLRKYQRRLDGRGATNPFEQKYSAASESSGGDAGEEGGGGEPSSGGFSEPSPPSYSPPPVESGGGGDGGSGGGGRPGELTHYSYAIDVRVSGGSGEQKKTSVRKNLPGLTMLPSRETPAIVYMGATKDGKKAVMTVSSDVKAIFGDAKCVLGSETCQMLVMEPGLPATFVYGGAEKTYTIELLKVELVETDKLNKAALGKPKQGKGNNKGARLFGISDDYQR